jgi:hypothetical protein
MIVRPNLLDIDFDTPTNDGDFDAKLVKKAITDAEVTTVIGHNLGRVPRKITKVWSDNPFDFEIVDEDGVLLVDEQSATIIPFESETTVILRFE